MKAKDYAEEWKASGKTSEGLAEIASLFIQEIPRLCEARNARRSSAMIAVFREIDSKWKAFARMFEGDVDPDGLRKYMLIIPSGIQVCPMIILRSLIFSK